MPTRNEGFEPTKHMDREPKKCPEQRPMHQSGHPEKRTAGAQEHPQSRPAQQPSHLYAQRAQRRTPTQAALAPHLSGWRHREGLYGGIEASREFPGKVGWRLFSGS